MIASPSRGAVALAFAVALASVAPRAEAQSLRLWESTALEVAAHGGAIRFDVEGTEPSLGGRVGIHFANGLGLGVALDWASRRIEFEGQSADADTWLYAAEARYTIPSTTPANFFVFGGLGQARFEPGPLEEIAGAEATEELLIPIGLGILWANHPGPSWWAIRAELRDNIILLDASEEHGRDDDAVTNNYALAVGLAVLLGGGP
ncbi:MAG: hypothetical protein R3199_10250 [Gemmatimonadota bacterium]|nr:hypothetical protein [Gemmatimonadota bacterium]